MVKNAGNGNLKSSFLNIVAQNGWDHCLCKHAKEGTPIELVWDICLDGKDVSYRLSFQVGSIVENCNIVLEELGTSEPRKEYDQEFNYFRCHDPNIGSGSFFNDRQMSFTLDSKEALVMQFKDILLNNQKIYGNELIRVETAQLLNKLQKYFEGYSVYTSAQFDSKKMREPVNMKVLDEHLNKDASNFTNVFNRYKSENVIWKNQFEEKLKDMIPDLQVSDIVSAYDKYIFKMVFGDEQYDLSDVSEGTLKGLILNMLINMTMGKPRSLLAIDEPETDLHPAWQKVIGEWIQTADTYKQCFISTHSPDFLDSFTEGFIHGKVAVFAFGKDEPIKKIQYEDVKDELGDWELGDLYRTNDPALGGWPW